jgi:hypothetical protein
LLIDGIAFLYRPFWNPAAKDGLRYWRQAMSLLFFSRPTVSLLSPKYLMFNFHRKPLLKYLDLSLKWWRCKT